MFCFPVAPQRYVHPQGAEQTLSLSLSLSHVASKLYIIFWCSSWLYCGYYQAYEKLELLYVRNSLCLSYIMKCFTFSVGIWSWICKLKNAYQCFRSELQPTIANWRSKMFIQLQVFYNKNYRRVLYFKSFINDVAECCKTLQTHPTSFSINPTTKLYRSKVSSEIASVSKSSIQDCICN